MKRYLEFRKDDPSKGFFRDQEELSAKLNSLDGVSLMGVATTTLIDPSGTRNTYHIIVEGDFNPSHVESALCERGYAITKNEIMRH
jgi:hypothetical protein